MNLVEILRSKPGSYTILNSIRSPERRERNQTGSQRGTPSTSPTLVERGTLGEQRSQVHWVLYWKMDLTPKEKGLVLESLILRMIISGLTFGDYLILSELRFLFREDSKDIQQIRLVVFADILLNQTLSWEIRVQMVKKLYESENRDYRRIYGNLKKTWLPEKFISFRDTPLETYIDQSPEGVPYSSYCKGYGEGSSRGQEILPFSAETDGEEEATDLDIRILKFAVSLLAVVFQAKRYGYQTIVRKQ